MVETTIHIGLPLFVGIIIGIIEGFFVYEDENMTNIKQAMSDIWHGLLFAVIFTIIASNVPYILTFEAIPDWINSLLFIDENGNSIVVSILISIFMLIKMVTSHAIKGVSNNGFTEKFWHKLVVALAVGFSPYYIIGLYDIFEPYSLPWFPF